MRKLYLLFCLVLFATAAIAQGSIEGVVTDAETGEPILFGTVSMLKDDIPVTGTDTDLNGYYSINGLSPGTYDVEVTYVGYQPQRKTGVLIVGGKTIEVNFEVSAGVLLEEVEIVEYKAPLFEKDQTGGGRTVTSESIQQIATRNVNTIAATSGGVATIDGGELNIRGARANATNYYVDGVRVSANLIPDSEIEQLQAITSGLEAKYGDATGGVISITTKGPANKFNARVEGETSQFLDDFERSLVRGSMSGPIIKDKETDRTILGYRFSGQYRFQKYPYRYLGHYIFPENTIEDLENQPLRVFGDTDLPRAEQFDNARLTRQTPNEQNEQLTGTARIDLRLSDAINVSMTAAYRNTDFNFVPGSGQTLYGGNSGSWRRLNYRHNPFGNNENLRTNVRFRHRIGGSGLNKSEEQSAGFIRNVSYSVQFAFERNNTLREDSRHEDRFFNYGYVGRTESVSNPTFGFQVEDGTARIAHVDYQDSLVSYTPSGINPVFDAFNEFVDTDVANPNFRAQNSLFTIPEVWNGFFSNPGNVYNRYSKTETDRYTLNLESSLDLFPGGSDKGRHNIEFGIMYEQRLERNYTLVPGRLWLLGNQLANTHINGIDTSDVIGSRVVTIQGFTDTVDVYNTLTLTEDELGPDTRFYRTVREKFGISLNEKVFVDEFSPDEMDLEMFSAFELADNNLVGFTGYDYLGNKTSSDASFEGFFKDRNPDGSRSFISPANEPIYTGVYLQDKFSYKDLIFKIGVRMDRYDANTQVLRDPYSLYEIQSADAFFAGVEGESRPDNIGEDWKVYTTSSTSDNVQAYRDGDQWYRPDGTAVNDPVQIFGAQTVNPRLVDEEANIRDAEYDLNGTFEDYEPVLNWMPRIAFSFPISDEANFFAHYDVYYQRPLARNFVSPLTYFFLEENSYGANNPLSNANLQPEKTTDFEVGFQQKISNNSSLRIAAAYREFQDQIQARLYNYTRGIGNSNRYFGFDNIDVSTVKSLNFRYDVRRINNLEMYLSYSLQFAEGTGSDATSQLSLVGNGEQVTEIFPLSFDERHQVNLSLDYRYGSGSKYNGPTIGGKQIFANTGVNILAQAISGRPFTKQQQPALFGGSGFDGGINESRYPFRFNIDLQVNKLFRLNPNADMTAGQKPLNLNVFFRALNLLNTENIIGWYRASLSDTDDGYLLTPQGQGVFNQIVQSPERNEDIWLQARQWGLVNNSFYALPRRMLIGASISF